MSTISADRARLLNRSGSDPFIGRGHPAPGNAVVLALVVALLDLEQRRGRGKVRPAMDQEPAA